MWTAIFTLLGVIAGGTIAGYFAWTTAKASIEAADGREKQRRTWELEDRKANEVIEEERHQRKVRERHLDVVDDHLNAMTSWADSARKAALEAKFDPTKALSMWEEAFAALNAAEVGSERLFQSLIVLGFDLQKADELNNFNDLQSMVIDAFFAYRDDATETNAEAFDEAILNAGDPLKILRIEVERLRLG